MAYRLIAVLGVFVLGFLIGSCSLLGFSTPSEPDGTDDLTPDTSLLEVDEDFDAVPGGELSGEVSYKGRYGDELLEGADVSIVQGGKALGRQKTDAGGYFSFDRIPRGNFDLWVSKGEKYAKYEYYETSSDQEDEREWLNAADFLNAKHYLNVYLTGRQTTLRGRVESAEDSSAIAKATVDTYPPTLIVETDSQGEYIIQTDAFEDQISYQVQVRHPRFETNGVVVESLRLAKENKAPLIQLVPRPYDPNVQFKQKRETDDPGEVTSGS
ncbi:MAG: hypothetical protein GKR89_36800 [Candidatus Latescibacteria bacterium]|nr:hypothetical protein [Candidatus Latescibacterota bacterium]